MHSSASLCRNGQLPASSRHSVWMSLPQQDYVRRIENSQIEFADYNLRWRAAVMRLTHSVGLPRQHMLKPPGSVAQQQCVLLTGLFHCCRLWWCIPYFCQAHALFWHPGGQYCATSLRFSSIHSVASFPRSACCCSMYWSLHALRGTREPVHHCVLGTQLKQW